MMKEGTLGYNEVIKKREDTSNSPPLFVFFSRPFLLFLSFIPLLILFYFILFYFILLISGSYVRVRGEAASEGGPRRVERL